MYRTVGGDVRAAPLARTTRPVEASSVGALPLGALTPQQRTEIEVILGAAAV